MMRVVHLSYAENAGGAALAAERLHGALRAAGVDSTLFVGLAQAHGGGVQEFECIPGAPAALNHGLFRLARRLQRRVHCKSGPLFSQDWTVLNCAPLRQLPPADIYHLHWVSDLVDFRMLPPLARRAPLVWTFHDMNPFTGGCHYDEGCGRFTEACGCCPQLAAPAPHDVSARVFGRKRDLLARVPTDRMTILAPSRWMEHEAHRSTLLGRFPSRVIPNGIDLEVFRPATDRSAVRARLGLQPQDRVVLFVADILSDTRKGWAELEQALARLTHLPHLRVLTIGSGDTSRMSGAAFRHLGRLSAAEDIRDAYAAADLFVIPSLQDNFPNTVLESLACGTPVVGFDAGGISDAVEEGSCGLLAPVGDTTELAAKVTRLLLDDDLRSSMRLAARARACALYGLEQQAASCLDLYRDLLAPQASTPVVVATERLETSLSP